MILRGHPAKTFESTKDEGATCDDDESADDRDAALADDTPCMNTVKAIDQIERIMGKRIHR